MQILFIITAVVAIACVRGYEDLFPGDSAQYQYEYGVASPQTGDLKVHREQRNGHFVNGEYALRESDGTDRIVRYRSGPQSGFEAVVQRSGVALHPALGFGGQQICGFQVGGQGFGGQGFGGQGFGGQGFGGLQLGGQGIGIQRYAQRFGGQGIFGGQGLIGGQGIIGGQGLGFGGQGFGGQIGVQGIGGQGFVAQGLGAGLGGAGITTSFVGGARWGNQGSGHYH